MGGILEYMEGHAGVLGLISSICMLIVTTVYAIIMWWQARYTKQTLMESIRQSREEKQPYVVPKIDSVTGGAFDTTKYIRVQLHFHYSLENVGDSSAVTLYTFLYAKLQYRPDDKMVYAHLMPEYIHSLRVGQKEEDILHFETNEFRDIIEDLEICSVKNTKRVETDATVTPYQGPIIILRCLYMNMMGQWFESVLEQELLCVTKKELSDESQEKDNEETIFHKESSWVTNNDIADGDSYEGSMINPSYSILSRRMVDYDYVQKVLDECRECSSSKLEYLRT